MRPGVIIARKTFGGGVRFHPHLHAIVTGGGWSEGCTWQPIFGWDRPVLGKLFEAEVFRFLRKRGLLSAERMELIRSWRHSGFNVYVGEAIGSGDRQTLEHVARYLLRAPVSLERLWYNPEAGTVTIRPQAGEGDSPVEMEALEFIARLIAKVYLEDPLLCPECGHGMQILSFITDPPVVDRILQHLNHKRREHTRRSPRGGRMPGLLIAGPIPALFMPQTRWQISNFGE